MQTQEYTTFNFEISNDKTDIIQTIKTLLKAYDIKNKTEKPTKNIKSLSQAIDEIFDNTLCISDSYAIGSCSTCGCGEADKLVKQIDNIEDELINFDIENMIKDAPEFSSYRGMPKELKVIVFIFYRVGFDKNKVLKYWIENLPDNCIKFFDAILFYVIRMRIGIYSTRNMWHQRCKILSEKYNDNSLKESIGYTFPDS